MISSCCDFLLIFLFMLHVSANRQDDDDEDALFIRPDEATVIADGDLSDSDDAAASGLLGITNGISILGRKVSML